MLLNRLLYIFNLIVILVTSGLFLLFYVFPDYERELVENNKHYVISLKNVKTGPLPETEKEIRKVRFFLEGFGFEAGELEAAQKLPKEIAIGVTVYSIEGIEKICVAGERNVFVNIPVDIDASASKGPLVLSPKHSQRENAQRLEAIFSRANGCKGFYVGKSNSAEEQTLLRSIHSVIRDRGSLLYYASVEGSAEMKSSLEAIIPVLMIEGDHAVALEERLSVLESDAKFASGESDVMIRRPSIDTLKKFNEWLDKRVGKSIKLVAFS